MILPFKFPNSKCPFHSLSVLMKFCSALYVKDIQTNIQHSLIVSDIDIAHDLRCYNSTHVFLLKGLPRWHSGKESAWQCRRCRRHGFYPWVGKSPWRRNWQPTPVFLPGKCHEQRKESGGLRSVRLQKVRHD